MKPSSNTHKTHNIALFTKPQRLQAHNPRNSGNIFSNTCLVITGAKPCSSSSPSTLHQNQHHPINTCVAVVADGFLLGWLMSLFPDWLLDGLFGFDLIAWVSALVLGWVAGLLWTYMVMCSTIKGYVLVNHNLDTVVLVSTERWG